MTKADFEANYRDYISRLNQRDWTGLAQFVDGALHYNGKLVGLDGYRAMLEADCEKIPDLRYAIEILVADPPHIACRLRFDVTPKGEFLGLPVDGRRVSFCENVFYAFNDAKIQAVWSVIDKAAIEAQLR